MPLSRDEVLALHREWVAIPSVSHQEERLADSVERSLRDHTLGCEASRVTVDRIGDNVVALCETGEPNDDAPRPRVLLNSHLDTVPPGEGWTRDPWRVTVEDGRVYGLGSNDAKAPAVAMFAAFVETAWRGGPCDVALLLAPEEETGGCGTELAWPKLRQHGFEPDGVIVGEPTDLQIAIAQKGLMVLELHATGDGGHSANAMVTGAKNAVRELARDLITIETLDFGDPHPLLGPISVEPTIIEGGVAKNKVPEAALCVLDVRNVPGLSPQEIVARLELALGSEVRVRSDRLVPRSCDPDAAIVRAAQAARPDAELYGSRTMSDLVYFDGVDAIKVGPGRTERSHQPDEYVLESEILDGVEFYSRSISEFATIALRTRA